MGDFLTQVNAFAHEKLVPKRKPRTGRSYHNRVFWLIALAFAVSMLGLPFGIFALSVLSKWFLLLFLPWVYLTWVLGAFMLWYERKNNL